VTILHIQPSFLQLAERALMILLSLPLRWFQHYLMAGIAERMGLHSQALSTHFGEGDAL